MTYFTIQTTKSFTETDLLDLLLQSHSVSNVAFVKETKYIDSGYVSNISMNPMILLSIQVQNLTSTKILNFQNSQIQALVQRYIPNTTMKINSQVSVSRSSSAKYKDILHIHVHKNAQMWKYGYILSTSLC